MTTLPATAMISCLTVTRMSRLSLLARAIGDYAAQTHTVRELVVVHDDGPACSDAIEALVAQSGASHVRVHAAPAGQALGALRNVSLAHAGGEYVCQWDDDDRCHPARLALQASALSALAADFAFFTDQLHWFVRAGRMTWDDWRRETHPLDFIQGTLFGRRAAMPAYEPLPRGEDTALCRAIIAGGARIARIDDAGWSTIYVTHGANAWPEAHHAAIAQAKALRPAQLLARAPLLAARLAEYVPPPGRATVDPAGRFITIA